MQSSGGSISADVAAVEPVRTILSGPSGGVVGALRVAASAAIENVMRQGLRAEIAERYVLAEKFYTRAHNMDPADPTPGRDLSCTFSLESRRLDVNPRKRGGAT